MADPWCTSGWLQFSAWELVVWHNHVPGLRLLLEVHQRRRRRKQQQQQQQQQPQQPQQHQNKRQLAVLAKSLRMALEMGHWEAAKLLLPYDICLPETGNILHWTLSEANRYHRIENGIDKAGNDHKNNDVEQWLPTSPTEDSVDASSAAVATEERESNRPYHHFINHVVPFVLEHCTDRVQLCRQVRADGATPLHVVGPFVTAAQTILQILLLHQTNDESVSPTMMMGPPGNTILHTAVRFPRVLKLFLAQIPSHILSTVNQYDDDTHRDTPLALACRLGAVHSVKAFLQHGSYPVMICKDAKNRSHGHGHVFLTEYSVLTVAAQGPSLDALYLLVHHAVGDGQLVS